MNIDKKDFISIFGVIAGEALRAKYNELLPSDFNIITRETEKGITILLEDGTSKEQFTVGWGYQDPSIVEFAKLWLVNGFKARHGDKTISLAKFIEIEQNTDIDMLDDLDGMVGMIKDDNEGAEEIIVAEQILGDLGISSNAGSFGTTSPDSSESNLNLSLDNPDNFGGKDFDEAINNIAFDENGDLYVIHGGSSVLNFHESVSKSEAILQFLTKFIVAKAKKYLDGKDILEQINLIGSMNGSILGKKIYIAGNHIESNGEIKSGEVEGFDFFQIVSVNDGLISEERIVAWLSTHVIGIDKVTIDR